MLGVKLLQIVIGQTGNVQRKPSAGVTVGVTRIQIIKQLLTKHGLTVGVGSLHLIEHHACLYKCRAIT